MVDPLIEAVLVTAAYLALPPLVYQLSFCLPQNATVASMINRHGLVTWVFMTPPLSPPPPTISHPSPRTSSRLNLPAACSTLHSSRFSLRAFHADLHPDMHRKLRFLSVFPLVNLGFILLLISVSSISRRYGVAPRSI
ncbi:hypothetical protein EDB80DRAFT_697956 [Ilyonectria destructans]|nr:hypothetical protein EDB80DRAFT_697956 [Ilyonectria destructans]